MLEADIEKKACHAAKAAGWLAYKFSSPGKRSVPDRLFCKNGMAVFIEFKRPGGYLTPKQQFEIDKLQKAGFTATCCWSVNEAMSVLQAAENREGPPDVG